MGLTKRVTIDDIAQRADLSKSAVSLILLGRPGVGEETRERVLRIAQELGYANRRKNQVAAPQQQQLAFLVEERHFFSGEVFYTRVFHGIKQRVETAGFHLNILTVNDADRHTGRLTQMLQDIAAAAVFITGEIPSVYLDLIEKTGLPTILVDYESASRPWISVVVDNLSGARTAVRHLIDLGHRRIVCLSRHLNHPSIRQRIDGYILAMGEAFGQIDHRLLLLEEGQSEIEDGYAMARRLINSGLDFSAIFATTDPQAIGVLKALHEADIRVPEQVSVVGFDNIDWSQHTTPPLTTINIRRHALGQVAADCVIALLSRPAPSPSELPHRITLPVELVQRESTAALNDQAAMVVTDVE